MAVVEISKIQVRRGQENQTGVPILDSGEFGWASDTEQLYIGLRRVDGGSRDANVRILTENDLRNFFSTSSGSFSSLNTQTTYTYRDDTGIATSNTVTSWPAPALTAIPLEVVRRIQNKLDDIVNVKDFGVIGDGLTDDSDAIQSAIGNLFLADRWNDIGILDSDPGILKTLWFPKGNYRITKDIWIPGRTKILGEGIENTIIIQESTGTSFFRAIDNNSPTTPAAVNYFIADNLLGYYPDYIGISDLSLHHVGLNAISNAFVQLNCSSNSYIKNIRMIGTFTNTSTNSTSSYAGIEIRGTNPDTTKSKNIVIENCQFSQLYTGIRCNHDVDFIQIKNNLFNKLDRGVVFCDSPYLTDTLSPSDSDRLTTVGPKHAKINDNYFNQITRQGIYVGVGLINTSTYHVSENNTFDNVGNLDWSTNSSSSTGTSIIKFSTKNNISRNDTFTRYEDKLSVVNSVSPAASNNLLVGMVEGHTAIENDQVKTITITAGSSATVILLPISGSVEYANVKYNLYNNVTGAKSVFRKGTLDIYIPGDLSANDVTYVDNYNYFTDSAGSYVGWYTGVTNNYYKFLLWNKSPLGEGASFDVTVGMNPYTGFVSTGTYTNVVLNSPGSGYSVGRVINLLGENLGGITPSHNLNIQVATVDGLGGITSFNTLTSTATNLLSTTTTYTNVADPYIGGSGQPLYLDYQLSFSTT